jgi:hypothetical protein
MYYMDITNTLKHMLLKKLQLLEASDIGPLTEGGWKKQRIEKEDKRVVHDIKQSLSLCVEKRVKIEPASMSHPRGFSFWDGG